MRNAIYSVADLKPKKRAVVQQTDILEKSPGLWIQFGEQLPQLFPIGTESPIEGCKSYF